MQITKYFPPILGKGEYNCPHCNVYAKQFYGYMRSTSEASFYNTVFSGNSLFNEVLPRKWIVTKCEHCKGIALWHGTDMIFPKKLIVPPPNLDMNEEVRNDYMEAAKVLADSPRAAAALLRLALQKLCIQLNEKGENINEDIKSLVAKGLNPSVQKSLDALRITGNNAVHPGEINLSEEPDRVTKLFGLINFIARKMITEPKEIEGFYSNLPVGALMAIERRDKKSVSLLI